MNKFYSKHKVIVVYLFLVGYFFLFAYNISHYHVYDIHLAGNCFLLEKNENKATNQHLSYPDFQCPVHNTYSSVHTSLLSNQNIDTSIITQITLLKFNSEQYYFSNHLYPSNLLRAPPAFS